MSNRRGRPFVAFWILLCAVALPAALAPAGRWRQWWERLEASGAGRLLGGERKGEPPWERAAETRGAGLEEGKAWEYFEHWYGIRAFPGALIPESAYFEAWGHLRTAMRPALREKDLPWASIGPDNIGGRILSLAIDPADATVIWAGSASGGLWRSTTGGEGAAAWARVETGFPALAVSAVLLDPLDPQVMYIGTGEISRYQRPLVGTPGARASYGIGILKSADGGATWQTTGLDWSMDQHRAILALRFGSESTSVLWAATSEGLYKSTDAGLSWTNVHPVLMAMDVVVDPTNPDKIFVSHGQLNSTPDPGIYRSTDGGASWTLLGGGLPASNFGRTPLALRTPVPGGPSTVYAGVSDASTRQVIGLFRSTNDGGTWTNIAPVNWAGGQAWYDNVIGFSPHDANLFLCGGLDWYRSTQGGSSLAQVSYWYNGFMGEIPPGGDEGSPDYVHADQHALAFHPSNPQIVYVGSDGGVFKSLDGGATWSGKNGGLVTTQFYAGFAGGYGPSGIAVGGLQDNGTVKYGSSPSWSKIFGGDGGWCAIDPRDESVIYEEYVYLNMYRSDDGGDNWTEIHPYSSGEANFIAPFVVSESSPDIVYAGTRGVKRSTNRGGSWSYPDGNSNWNGTPMAVIGVAWTSPDTLLAGTGSGTTGAIVQLKRSTNGGTSWTDVSAGLPNRYPTDFGFCRNDSRQVWLTFSGYGSPHVYRSTDAGLTWIDRSGNLPDLPVQCVVGDPRDPEWAYVGTDLGVFVTLDGGASWMDFNAGMPVAQVLDLVISPEDRRMRAATFGNGVYEVGLPYWSSGVGEEIGRDLGAAGLLGAVSASPSPFRQSVGLSYRLERAARVRVDVFDAAGRSVRALFDGRRAAGESRLAWDGRDGTGRRVRGGVYFIRVAAGEEAKSIRVVAAR
jgi:photosystem II stability/assembly factor-like uncharacterized protein